MRRSFALFPAEPAGNAALGLRGTVLNLLVELVDLLHRASLGLLGVGFRLGLELCGLALCVGDLTLYFACYNSKPSRLHVMFLGIGALWIEPS